MHLIMLSGGSGQRLWPLSNDVRSKQFLKILPGPDGQKESMIQRVYRQISGVGSWQSVSVAASLSQREQLISQLGTSVNVISEPCRRDTFPAIALACAYLYSEKNVRMEEIIGILPVDPYVEDEYFRRINDIEKVFNEQKTDLVLLGAVPVKPSEKYGYIVPVPMSDQVRHGDVSSIGAFDVEYFKEKPDIQTAEKLIQEGALWNCGVFGLRLGYVFNILQDKYGIKDFSFSHVERIFKTLNKTSFDYEVVEKARNIKVIPYEAQWKDLGTWETLTEELKDHVAGNVVLDEGCANTHVINELDLPIVAMGLTNSVVVASHDGILVANKGDTYRLKEFAGIALKRPMYEERRWGRYVVLEHHKSGDGTESLTKRLYIDSGKQISYQYHNHRKEIWTVAVGQGLLYLNGEKRRVDCGDVIVIERGMKHGIKALVNLEILEIQIGDKLIEEDIIRMEYEWEEQ